MNLSKNVEVESNEAKASNSRASRMARYSTAAAGVAAVSTLDVDAAMIKVTVTDVQNVTAYTLDLSAIASNAKLYLAGSATSFYLWGIGASVAVSSQGSSLLQNFNDGSTIGGKAGKSWGWNIGGWRSSSSMGVFFGFRLNQGSSDYTYGWLNANIGGSSAFTLNSYGYNSTLNEVAIAGQGSTSSQVPDTGPGIVGLALIGAGAAGVRLLRKLRAGK
ncbi:hypothetical protein N8787_04910 [Opitutaceae bacterium]|nr:hypothetical protein [Opitutaceae bacterium]